jgi:ATP-dependent Clp protease ATP-binding subunit ClpC
MSEPDFWKSESRAETLSDIEYMDRIQVGLDTAGSLIGRLSGATATRQYHRPDLLQRLAQQLYLLDAACAALVDGVPRDAFLSIESSLEGRPDDAMAVQSFMGVLAQMYLGWAEKRRMRIHLYDPIREGHQPMQVLMAISGFGSYRILSPERGLHVLEVPREESSFNRIRARVRVAGQPLDAGSDADRLRRLARARLLESEEQVPTVVRRYRREPSPLVRDAVRDWRTGNIDQVLSGDFDLMT